MYENKAFEILQSADRAYADFPGDGSLNDKLSFGFSFIESHDHLVEYIIANSKMMQRILVEIPEAKLNPTQESLGQLWTADLLTSEKIKDNRVVFSNGGSTAVLFLETNPHKIGGKDANLRISVS